MRFTKERCRESIFLEPGDEPIHSTGEVFITYPCVFNTVSLQLAMTPFLTELADDLCGEEDVLSDLFKTDEHVEDDDFDLDAALKKAAFVKKGDIWTVGRHRLMCGDATSAEDVATLMDGKKANIIVTDPPYGVSI